MISFKAPYVGPSGRAVQIHLFGENYQPLSKASFQLQHRLSGWAAQFKEQSPTFNYSIKDKTKIPVRPNNR